MAIELCLPPPTFFSAAGSRSRWAQVMTMIGGGDGGGVWLCCGVGVRAESRNQWELTLIPVSVFFWFVLGWVLGG